MGRVVRGARRHIPAALVRLNDRLTGLPEGYEDAKSTLALVASNSPASAIRRPRAVSAQALLRRDQIRAEDPLGATDRRL